MNIFTLTMNPAVDKSSRIDHVAPERKLRCGPPVFEPGGGGINVSRALQNLGGQSTAVYPAGGPPGNVFDTLLTKENINTHRVNIAGWTRENLMIREKKSDQQYRFGMPGPELDRTEWQNCLEALFEGITRPAYIVASGSLPRGVPHDFYCRVAQRCRENNIRLVLDTSKEPLRAAVEHGVFMTKPNLNELNALAGRSLENESEQEAVARELIEKGKIRYLVVSLGAAGVLAVSAEGVQRVRAPTVNIRSKVGAGDSTVAGITLKLAEGWPFLDAVEYGVAAGAAAVMTPGTALCRQADADSLYRQMGGHNTGGATESKGQNENPDNESVSHAAGDRPA